MADDQRPRQVPRELPQRRDSASDPRLDPDLCGALWSSLNEMTLSWLRSVRRPEQRGEVVRHVTNRLGATSAGPEGSEALMASTSALTPALVIRSPNRTTEARAPSSRGDMTRVGAMATAHPSLLPGVGLENASHGC